VPRGAPDIHLELGRFVDGLRGQGVVRVMVITGAEDGEFYVPGAAPPDGSKRHRLVDPEAQWVAQSGVMGTLRSFLESEVPIVARVNGDAIGFGQSLLFVCDLVVARQDARVSDCHMAPVVTSTGQLVGSTIAKTPGDGAGALLPLLMSPARAKEYLFFSQVMTAAELVQAGIFNHAVPADGLDEIVDRLVQGLLGLPARAVAFTKRVANRGLAQQLNACLDLSMAYELLDIMHGADRG
jgi:enoyl-CoA hydratase/carnithine racemase